MNTSKSGVESAEGTEVGRGSCLGRRRVGSVEKTRNVETGPQDGGYKTGTWGDLCGGGVCTGGAGWGIGWLGLGQCLVGG